ncbi:MAG: hypothetical protein RLY58_2272 [Pseudomonadota bacterium]
MCVSVIARADMSILSQMPDISDYERLYEENSGFSDSDYQRLIGAVNSIYNNIDDKKTEIKQMECRETNLWKIQLIKKDIFFARSKIDDARSFLANERKAARISGYSNPAMRNMAAWVILDKEDKIKRLFAQYQSLGGKGKSAYTLGKPDPFCEMLTVKVDRLIPTKEEATVFFAEKKAKTDLAAAEIVATKNKRLEAERKARSCSNAYSMISRRSMELRKIILDYHNPEGDLAKFRAFYQNTGTRFSFAFQLKTDPVVTVEMLDPSYPTKEIALKLKTAIENINMAGMGCDVKFRINL